MRDLGVAVRVAAVPFRKLWSRGVAYAVSVELVDRRLVYPFEFLLCLSFFFSPCVWKFTYWSSQVRLYYPK